ncbi:MAG: hypothetical protein QM796_20785 [Chthoniobacteraceae bacterium]
MMNKTFFSGLFRGGLAACACLLSLTGAKAQIYVGQSANSDGTFTIGEYDYLSGSVIKDSVGPTSSATIGFALQGSTRLFTSDSASGEIGVYHLSTGKAINSALAQLTQSGPAMLDGNNLYVASPSDATVRKYNATTGALLLTINVNAASAGDTLVISMDGGGNLLVADGKSANANTIVSQYNVTTGDLITANYLTVGNSDGIGGMVADGSGRLYVSRPNANAVTMYDSFNGVLVYSSIVPGLNKPTSLVLDAAGHLFIISEGSGTVGEYDPILQTTINATVFTNTTATLRGLAVAFPTFAGRYTAIIDVPSDSNLPQGYGELVLTVKASGKVTLNGHLGDGTAVHATAKQAYGVISLNLPLYAKKGSLSGQLVFRQHSTSDLASTLAWTKPAVKTGLYLGGFSTSVNFGAAPLAAPALAAGSYSVVLSGGGLSSSITHGVTLATNGKVTVTDPGDDHLKLVINQATGSFSGSFLMPNAKMPTTFKGVIQQMDQGAGYFKGPTATGGVTISTPTVVNN